ncbi:MAG: RDD family protein [Rhodobacterales bacterium]
MLKTTYDLSGLPDPVLDRQFYAGVAFKRLLAWIIDSVIILLLTMGMVIVSLGAAAFIFPLALLAVNLGYRILTLSRYSATIGMMITGVEIRNSLGDKLNPTEAMWHTGLFTVITISFFALFISVFMMLTNARGQGLHDYFLGTTAINRYKSS